MRPVFVNSAWVTAPEWAILGGGSWRRRRLHVRFGFFEHPKIGPVLIDTGYTSHSLRAANRSFFLRSYATLLSPDLIEQGQVDRFLQTRGLKPSDIETVIVTHFHVDHVSGLKALPNARFFASGQAWRRIASASKRRNIKHGVFTELVPDDFGQRLEPVENCPQVEVQNLPNGFDVFGDNSLIAIPLPGHADGHLGLLFAALETPFLYAVDTQWVGEALPRPARPKLLPRLISEDFGAMQQSTDVVEAYINHGGHVQLCHDDAPSTYDWVPGQET